ncbi:helix-turn-helix transcriptional regulator [Leifsonia sp. ZF2019]|uniref:helix-turn-helix domain-containing protein n=1 Tax=Leifsonia sp. ZF2019 TaxID=2781978 RepID=UPI001CBC07E9|nr:helix-turn-helix transcriptional regulator [Leifsonia sp. ZF2019]UAJ79994.1 helix-turn-helix transcriptional regulator [Leifsonia sp. ZF2019]
MPDDRSTSKPIDRALADVLVAAYKGRRLNQAALVEKTGIKPATMQRLMAGKAQFDVDQLFAIADAIGTRTAADYLREAEANVDEASMSQAPSNVTDITSKGDKEFVWQGEENAYEEWDAVAKSQDSTIEIDPDVHTP